MKSKPNQTPDQHDNRPLAEHMSDTESKPSPEHKRTGEQMLDDVESGQVNTDRYDTSGNDEPSPKTSSTNA